MRSKSIFQNTEKDLNKYLNATYNLKLCEFYKV